MEKEPLVSCLCISQDRPDYLRKAISCFVAQTYVNKELIVVSRQYDPEYEEIISGVPGGVVKYYGLRNEATLTLGELRNYSIGRSSGDFFCIWDDDDWYHPARIEKQVQGILDGKKSGTILPYCLVFDKVNGDAYLSPPTFMHPASIMCRKDMIGQQDLYTHLNKREDVFFRNNLVEKRMLYPVIAPVLYIYVYHTGNTCDAAHFSEIFGFSAKLKPVFGQMIGDIVSHKYSCEEASALLSESELLDELDYFPGLWWP